jgi:N-acetylneuraminic acid mutarotase
MIANQPLLLLFSTLLTTAVAEPRNWTRVTDGPGARKLHGLVPLLSGALFLYAGFDNRSFSTNDGTNDAYLYTSSSAGGTWTRVADGPSARYGHAMAPLSDGRVLMHGGNQLDGICTNEASLYTPPPSSSVLSNGKEEQGGTWTRVADGPSARSGHAMAPLSDGRVFMYGGVDPSYAWDYLNDAYLYTSSSAGGTWTRVADGPHARSAHAMAPLSDGSILIHGGYAEWSTTVINSITFNDTYIYTAPSSTSSTLASSAGGTWIRVADGPVARAYHAMAMLTGGLSDRVVVYGGMDMDNNALNDVYVYDRLKYTKGTWTKVAAGPSARYGHAMAPLTDGRVLLYGGNDGGLYDFNNNDAWINDFAGNPPPAICCQAKSSDYKAKCAAFLDSKSCDDYSKGFGDFCAWKCGTLPTPPTTSPPPTDLVVSR